MKELETALRGELEPGVYEVGLPTMTTPATSELDRLAQEHGFSLFCLDGSKVSDKPSFLREAAVAMSFPLYFGYNWDAFHDCITDLDWWSPARGYVLLYDGFEPFAEGDPKGWEVVKDIFRSAVEFWKERKGTPMYVLLRPKGTAAAR